MIGLPLLTGPEQLMSETHRITVDPSQCGSRPCIRGLPIRVKDILDLLASGAAREEILQEYPLLETEDITAALEYAARQNDYPMSPASTQNRGAETAVEFFKRRAARAAPSDLKRF